MIDPQNSLSTIITVAAYLGSDDYDTQKKCLDSRYPLPLSPLLRYISGAYGKQRKTATGYPIPDAPEHANQLGDMTFICKKPVFTQKDSLLAENNFASWLKGKSSTKESRREFAKLNFSMRGRASLVRVEHDYVGTMHLGLRAAESLSIRISQCAKGKQALTLI